MRLLQISSARSVGGGEVHLINLIAGLRERGHTVFLAAPQNSPLPEKLPEIPGENVFAVRLRNAVDVRSAWRLRRLIVKHNIEIVHAHLARDYPLVALAVRGLTNVKFVVTRHVLFPLNGLHRFALSNVAAVIAVSRAVERQLREQKVFPVEKITVVPNGIDVARFAAVNRRQLGAEFRRQHRLQPSEFIISTVGELKPLKGQIEFIESAAIILRQQSNARFVIVGRDNSPDNNFRNELRALAEQNDLSEKVSWLTWIDDVAPLLSATDVFVSPSRSESFGLAIVEAMAAGCAIVAAATDGAREVLNDGSVGRLAPVGDIRLISKATIELLNDEDERVRLGARARDYARANYGLEQMIKRTEAVYQRILR